MGWSGPAPACRSSDTLRPAAAAAACTHCSKTVSCDDEGRDWQAAAEHSLAQLCSHTGRRQLELEEVHLPASYAPTHEHHGYIVGLQDSCCRCKQLVTSIRNRHAAQMRPAHCRHSISPASCNAAMNAKCKHTKEIQMSISIRHPCLT